MSTIIAVENLGKKYTLNHQARQGAYVALRDVLSDGVRNFGRRLLHTLCSTPRTPHAPHEEFWALKDVSFDLQQGDRLGIIGRNGAGKSTLLKILSRITEPTTGSVRIRGRVASLLEVGTGFHPELTGRENIFLNGAVLGMSRVEIRKKFDEIVAFAEVEKFLDTPVKRYSSGMYVRLAFAVAAHLEPEILVVDEVLAVGDAQFQKKCLGKMEDISVREGRTVLFVSHNMGVVKQLCDRAIVLSDGQVMVDGDVHSSIDNYLNAFRPGGSSFSLSESTDVKAYVKSVSLLSPQGLRAASFFMNHGIEVACDLVVMAPSSYTLSIQIKDLSDMPLFHFPCGDDNFSLPSAEGCHHIIIQLPVLYLYPGGYRMQVTLCEAEGNSFKEVHVVDNISFNIEQDYSLVGRPLGKHAGIVYAQAQWRLVPEAYHPETSSTVN